MRSPGDDGPGARMRLAYVSREVGAGEGGIGTRVGADVRRMSAHHDVTLITAESGRERVEAARATARFRVVYVPEPGEGEGGSLDQPLHTWSARLCAALCAAFPDGGPDLALFSDYLGEAAVAAQARRARDARLRRTTVAVHLATTAELVRVLNGALEGTEAEAILFALERTALLDADVLLHGPGDVIGTYQRYYGVRALAPALETALAAGVPFAPGTASARSPEGPLRLLYLGRLERRKGVEALVDGLAWHPSDGWELTLAGGDTPTARLGTSMRAALERAATDDPRISFRDPVPHDQVGALLDAHDALVVPSRWEAGPNVALEALARNRPVLGTPVGGLLGIVEPGTTGLLAAGTGPSHLAALVAEAVDRRADLAAMVAAGAPLARARELFSPERRAAAIEQVPRRAPHPGVPTADVPTRRGRPLVSVVVPDHDLDLWLEEAVASALAQDHRPLEVIVVHDGIPRDRSRAALDRLVGRGPVRVVTTRNRGVAAARNLGGVLARGRYVALLDADNVLEPSFVRRAVEVLEAEPAAGYVTSWSRYVGEDGDELPDLGAGYEPLGNAVPAPPGRNLAGDAAAVVRRTLFDRGPVYDESFHSIEDWVLYRRLARAGIRGHVIPERLFRYRVRARSTMREVSIPWRGRIGGEADAAAVEDSTRWTSTSR